MADATRTEAVAKFSRRLFEEIGRLACDVDRSQQDEPDARQHPVRTESQLLELRRAIRHIGWLADKGAHWNGGVHQLEGANDWLCSSQLRKAMFDAELAASENEVHDPAVVVPDGAPA